MSTDAAATFRALHRPGQPFLLPNAWDYATAAVLVAAGFTAIGTTSLGVAAAAGLPDAHGLIRDETVALTHRLATLPCLCTVDVEAGFSDEPADVAELAAELAEAGAVGMNLEDGRPDGTLADPGRQDDLIRAVKQRVPALFLNARVDTYWLGAGGLAAALSRAERYEAAGADGVFVPGVAAEDDIRAVVSTLTVPLNVLYLPGRHTMDRLAALGVSRVSTGSLLFRTAVRTVADTAQAVRDGLPVSAEVPSYRHIQDTLLAVDVDSFDGARTDPDVAEQED
ncbi:MAG TPA: isocitrate lyase/phosphoenolpyruvate mutase family protein [Actinophytocola sp.]|nr:isocitrate lyase/phosphoenolpyruvate mutase family protein [Actinophytocola sp.]